MCLSNTVNVSHLSPARTKAAEVVEVCQSIRETHQAPVSFSSVHLQTLIIWDYGRKKTNRRKKERIYNLTSSLKNGGFNA